MHFEFNIEKINNTVLKFVTYEFQIVEINNNFLKIFGSQDFFYGHNMEILLKDPHFIESKINWRSETDKNVCFEIVGDENTQFNLRNNILIENKTIKFIDEDGKSMYFSFGGISVELK